jgi:hypothetical protein
MFLRIKDPFKTCKSYFSEIHIGNFLSLLRASLAEPLFLGTEKTEFSLSKNKLRADLATAQNRNRKRELNSLKSNIAGNRNSRLHSISSEQAEFVHNFQ